MNQKYESINVLEKFVNMVRQIRTTPLQPCRKLDLFKIRSEGPWAIERVLKRSSQFF